jgi:hypothetical protein
LPSITAITLALPTFSALIRPSFATEMASPTALNVTETGFLGSTVTSNLNVFSTGSSRLVLLRVYLYVFAAAV